MLNIGLQERPVELGDLTYTSGSTSDKDIPMHTDIKRIDAVFTIVTGAAAPTVSNLPYSPLGLMDLVTIKGDGFRQLTEMKGEHLPGVHRQFYNSPGTVTACSTGGGATTKNAYSIPITAFRNQFRDLNFKINWGTAASVNTDGGFSITSAKVNLTIIYGRQFTEMRIFFKSETNTSWNIRVPEAGLLEGVLLHSVDETESTYTTVTLEHEGNDTLSGDWYSLSVAERNATQQAHVTGQLNISFNILAIGNNTYLKLTSSGSKAVDFVYFFTTTVKPVSKAGNKVIIRRPINVVGQGGNLVKAFGVSGATQLVNGTVPRGTDISTIGVGFA